MRLIKMLSLAAIAAVAAMAFLGASSASAGNTLLCSKKTESLTPGAAECGVVTSVHVVTVGHVVLLGGINVECNGLLSGKTNDTLGSPVVFDEDVLLSYTNCLGGCGFKVTKQGTVTVLKTGAELAAVTGVGFTSNVTCFGLNCDYDSSGLVGHAIMSEGETHVVYTKNNLNVLEKLGGFINCPSTGVLDALYRSLTDIFIRA